MSEGPGPDAAVIQCYAPDGCCSPSPCDVTLDDLICQIRSLLPQGDIYNNTLATPGIPPNPGGAIMVCAYKVDCEQLVSGGCCDNDAIYCTDTPVAPQLAVVDSYSAATYEAVQALCQMLRELDPCTAELTIKLWAKRFGIDAPPCEPMWSDHVLSKMMCVMLQMRWRQMNWDTITYLAGLFGAEIAATFAGDMNCGPTGWWTMARDNAVCEPQSNRQEVLRITPTCIGTPLSINIVIRPGPIQVPANCNLAIEGGTLPHDPELYEAFKWLLPKILPQPAYYCIYEENVADCISIDAINTAPSPVRCH
jgi:hypothetical protein